MHLEFHGPGQGPCAGLCRGPAAGPGTWLERDPISAQVPNVDNHPGTGPPNLSGLALWGRILQPGPDFRPISALFPFYIRSISVLFPPYFGCGAHFVVSGSPWSVWTFWWESTPEVAGRVAGPRPSGPQKSVQRVLWTHPWWRGEQGKVAAELAAQVLLQGHGERNLFFVGSGRSGE